MIHIAGVGGHTGSAEFTIGGSVNAAMLNLTQSLADRGNMDGVRVNAINPGYIATDRLTARIQKRRSRSILRSTSRGCNRPRIRHPALRPPPGNRRRRRLPRLPPRRLHQ